MSGVELPFFPGAAPNDAAKLAGLRRELEEEKRKRTVRPATFEIKLYDDESEMVEGDPVFVFALPSDVDAYGLIEAQAYLSTVASTTTTVRVVNLTQAAADMLTTPITIDAGEFSSFAAAPSVPDPDHRVARGDRIGIAIDDVGGGGLGLGVMLTFRLLPPPPF